MDYLPLTRRQQAACAEFKLAVLRDLPVGPCADTPEKAVAFYEEHVKASPIWCFDKETMTVLFMNTRAETRHPQMGISG